MGSAFTATVEQVPLATILRLAGAASAVEIKTLETAVNQIAPARPSLVVIDMSRLEFMASLAMGQIVALHKTLKYHGGRVVLAGASGPVLEALHLARLGSLMQILPSVDAALWSVS